MSFKSNFAFKILCLVYVSKFAVDSQLLKCSNQPCKNGGQCVEQPGTYYGYNCRCVGSWKGVNCDQDVVIGENPRLYNNQYNPNYPNSIPSWQNQNNPLWNNQNQNNALYPNNNNLNNQLYPNNNNLNNPLYPNNNYNNLNNQYNRPNNPNWNSNQYNVNNPNSNNPLWNNGLNSNQNNPLWNNQNQNNPIWNSNNPLHNPAHNPYDSRYPTNIAPYGNNNNPLALNDPCINNPCQNGGYCQRTGLGLGGFTCSCSSGFYGSRCENYASQRTMLLGIILGTVLPGCAFIIICAIIIYCCCCRRRLK